MSTRQRTQHTTHPRELRWLVPTYPRIAHVPYQPNAARDDLVASEAEAAVVFGARRLTVTEKFDGACLALARQDGVAVAATRDHVLRKGYLKETQAKRQFVDVWRWCDEHRRRFEYLERARGGPVSVFGEWLRMPHTVRYSAATPRFVAFEIYDAGARAFLDPLLAEELLRAAGFAVADRLPIERVTAWEELATLARGATPWSALDAREGVVVKIGDGEKLTHRFKMVRPDFVRGQFFKVKE